VHEKFKYPGIGIIKKLKKTPSKLEYICWKTRGNKGKKATALQRQSTRDTCDAWTTFKYLHTQGGGGKWISKAVCKQPDGKWIVLVDLFVHQISHTTRYIQISWGARIHKKKCTVQILCSNIYNQFTRIPFKFLFKCDPNAIQKKSVLTLCMHNAYAVFRS